MKIEIKNLVLQDKEKVIIDDVSFGLNKGEKVCIIGKSGSGKTQLMRSILKLSKLEKQGDILIDGNTNYVLGKDITVIFQDYDLALNPVLTIQKQMIEALVYSKKLTEKEAILKAKEALKKVNLDQDLLSRYPFELSGGQKQRVIIATCLMLETDILICDEITTGLDKQNEIEIINLLKSLDKTILFITHSVYGMKNFSDRVIMLEAGKKIYEGKFNEISNIQDNDYVKSILRLGDIK